MRHQPFFGSLISTILLFFTVNAVSQDFILKNDKTEIKSKVTEITETAIKYKKWDNIDGPVYSIPKSDVFMITYANRQREIIKATPPDQQPIKEQPATPTTDNSLSGQLARSQGVVGTKLDTAIDYRSLRVRYHPSRVLLGFSPFSVGSDVEFRIVRNVLNLGFGYTYSSSTEFYNEKQAGYVYLSGYLPLNRVIGEFKNQNKGLFLFGHLGYGFMSEKVLLSDFSYGSVGSSSVIWRTGADYFFSKNFGITACYMSYQGFMAGVAVHF